MKYKLGMNKSFHFSKNLSNSNVKELLWSDRELVDPNSLKYCMFRSHDKFKMISWKGPHPVGRLPVYYFWLYDPTHHHQYPRCLF